MKTLTKKQRGEIYLKAAQEVLLHPNVTFLCPELKEAISINNQISYGFVTKEDLMNQFPEFELFKQNKYVWFKNMPEARIICMLLCYEMTK